MLVAYQGETGAFSEDAARKLLPGVETRGYGTFDEVFYAAVGGEVDAALMPVETSISGAVRSTSAINLRSAACGKPSPAG